MHWIPLFGALIATALAHADDTGDATGDAASGSGELGSGDDTSSDATLNVGLLVGSLFLLVLVGAGFYACFVQRRGKAKSGTAVAAKGGAAETDKAGAAKRFPYTVVPEVPFPS
jgi:hypothetical protein